MKSEKVHIYITLGSTVCVCVCARRQMLLRWGGRLRGQAKC